MNSKKEPASNFFRISHLHVENPAFKLLKPTAQILYFQLCRLRNRYGKNGGVFFRTIEDLSDDTGMSRKSVIDGVKALIKIGYLSCKKGKRNLANSYRIIEKNTRIKSKKEKQWYTEDEYQQLCWMDYKEYLKSKYWSKVRLTILRLNNFSCLVCGSNKKLQVHHKEYVPRGTEHLRLDVLECLCSKCHSSKHNK